MTDYHRSNIEEKGEPALRLSPGDTVGLEYFSDFHIFLSKAMNFGGNAKIVVVGWGDVENAEKYSVWRYQEYVQINTGKL
jgi:hypothetical protein